MRSLSKDKNQKDLLSRVEIEKEEYTVPEIVELVSKHFKIEIRDEKKHVNQNQKALSQKIRRTFEQNYVIEPVNESERKTAYSKEDVDWLINDKLYSYFYNFCKTQFPQEDEFDIASKEYNERARLWKKTSQQSGEDLNKELCEVYEYAMEHPEENDIQAWVKNKKLEIVIDFITKHCIEISEDLLESDLSLIYTDDNTPPHDKPMPIDIQRQAAYDRMKDLHNYYKILNEDIKEDNTD